jgi:hypothetical protein
MSAPPHRDCTVCTDPALCAQHGLLVSHTTKGDWATNPLTTEIRCTLEDDKPAALVYQLLIGLAAKLDVDIAELMRQVGEA